MLEESKKSIQSILNQRINSPFYGTLIISWAIWNWKIIYLTFVISEKKLETNKIDYIVSNYSEFNHLIWFPLLSTLIILTILPFITNASFWLDLKFDKWRIDKKNEVEKKQLLTLEQSISIREELVSMENRFDTLLSNKNAEIEQLKLLVNKLENDISSKENVNVNTSENNQFKELESIANKILTNEKLRLAHKTIKQYIQGGYSQLVKAESITPDILDFFDSNRLTQKNEKGIYIWTSKGMDVNKLITDQEFK